jgi:uncharacterized surface protein with fasciclin (FAS1) repeats
LIPPSLLDKEEEEDEEPDIVGIATTTSGFSTFVDLLIEADLVATLQGDGPFTVFAPTDAAFNALPTEIQEDLAEDVAALTEVLLYHVVSGEVLSTDLVDGASVATVQGSDVMVSLGDKIKINNAVVITADIMASNGVVHVLDEVSANLDGSIAPLGWHQHIISQYILLLLRS